MQLVFYKDYFKNMLKEDIRLWIDMHKERLIGSAIFTKGQTWSANLVAWAEGWRCPDKNGFCPTHTGSIIEKNGEVLIFDMKPPRACTQSLERYLWTTKEDFVIVLRDFELDTRMFSLNLLNEVGRGYPYMSAIRSVFSKRETKWNCHCSEMHLRELQKQMIFLDVKSEITPDELLHIMVVGKNYVNNKILHKKTG